MRSETKPSQDALLRDLWGTFAPMLPSPRRNDRPLKFLTRLMSYAKRQAVEEEASVGVTETALWIAKRSAFELGEEVIRAPEKNLLSDDNPLVSALRKFANSREASELLSGRLEVRDLYSERPSLMRALGSLFGVTPADVCFHGLPLIGWDADRVWFGFTSSPWLWDRLPRVRAAALAHPVRYLTSSTPAPPDLPSLGPPEPLHPGHRRNILRHLLAANLTPLERPQFSQWHSPTGTIAIRFAPTSGALRRTLHALHHRAFAGEVLLVTNLAPDALEEPIYSVLADTSDAIDVTVITDDTVHAFASQLPWHTRSARRIPVTCRNEDAATCMRCLCFIDEWRRLAPTARWQSLGACWTAVGFSGGFLDLVAELSRAHFLKPDACTPQDLILRSVQDERYGRSELHDLIWRWLLDHPNALPDEVYTRAIRPRGLQTKDDYRAWYAIWERHPDDRKAERSVALGMMQWTDAHEGWRMFKEILTRTAGDVESERWSALLDVLHVNSADRVLTVMEGLGLQEHLAEIASSFMERHPVDGETGVLVAALRAQPEATLHALQRHPYVAARTLLRLAKENATLREQCAVCLAQLPSEAQAWARSEANGQNASNGVIGRDAQEA